MKAYILYLATLLAALVLPATAQTGSTNTKAAPDFPSMPYRLTVNAIGDNQGEVTFEDKSYNGGVVTIDNAPHAYGNQDPAKTTTVTPTITSNPGYALDNGYPKAYKTGDPTTPVTIAADGTFAMPTHPVTIDVKYIKVDDLDLSKLTGEVTLIYDGGKNTWKYKAGADTTLFTGTLKGKGTCDLKITSSNGGYPALYLANGTELTGNIEVATQYNIELGLSATIAGTVATVRGNITFNEYTSLMCYVRLRLNIYGTVIGSTGIANFMQWTWTKAPESGKTITIYTPLEETLTTFTADSTHTSFATNFPYGNTPLEMKVKVGDAIQIDDKKDIIFPTDNANGYLCTFTGMEDSKLEPVEQPKDVNGITITGGTTYKEGETPAPGTSDKPFSGTITGDVSTIKVDAAVTGNPIIILNDVKKKGSNDNTVEVANKAKVTLALKGTANEVSTMTVAAGGTLTLTTVAGGASFAKDKTPTISNSGTFTSETRLIKKVGGTAPLEVTADPVGKQIAKDEEHILKVDANIPVPAAPKAMTRSTDPVPSYQWQKYTSEYGWRSTGKNIPTHTTTEAGTYRCIVTSKNGTATTTLTTQVAEVTLKSDPGPGPGPDPVPDPDPTPTPTYYTVTLPTLVGATTDPAAGTYNVEAWGSFVFALTPSKDYDQSKPVVTTSRGETITPRAADGKYEVTFVRESITLTITGIEKNNPTGNATVETDAIRIWTTAGALHISTPQPAPLDVYTLSGQCLRRLNLPAGDSQITLPAGVYLLRTTDRQQKVFVR